MANDTFDDDSTDELPSAFVSAGDDDSSDDDSFWELDFEKMAEDEAFWKREPAEIAADMVRGPELFFRPFDLWLAEYDSYVEFWSKNVDMQERWTSISGNVSILWDYDVCDELLCFGEKLYCNMEKIRKALSIADQCPLVSKLTAQLMKSGCSLSEIQSNCGSIPHEGRTLPRVGLQDAIDLLKQRLKFESLTGTSSDGNGKGKRTCHDRDHTFLLWQEEGMKPAGIRDRWNREHPDDAINLEAADNGRGVVKAGIKAAQNERKLEENC